MNIYFVAHQIYRWHFDKFENLEGGYQGETKWSDI